MQRLYIFWNNAELGDKEGEISTLIELLSDNDSSVRNSAAQALGNLGKDSDKVIPQIVQWLEENQDCKFVGNGIDVLWNMVTSE